MQPRTQIVSARSLGPLVLVGWMALGVISCGVGPDKPLSPADTSPELDSGPTTSTPPIDGDEDGYSVEDGDCDDDAVDIHPGASEVCDDIDNDCDGLVDDEDSSLDLGTATTWFWDDDGDGFGAEGVAFVGCSAPSGTVAEHPAGFDCDDTDPAFYPGAVEDDCTDPEDYNCDGSVGYADADEDGWAACEDCDDDDGAVNPDAIEVCDDGLDNDCNDLADDLDPGLDPETATRWYRDLDGDGYGDEDDSLHLCVAPEGYVAADVAEFDCDDTDAAFHPGAVEDDCTDPADYNCDGSLGYVDADGDGWAACEDCDDLDESEFPGADEVCDGDDDDCDGEVDEDSAVDAPTWYIDYDGDGFGSDRYTVVSCTVVAGYTDDGTDCDDARADIHSDAPEVCDEADADEDCDGASDDADEEGATGKVRYYTDGDGDGFGAADDEGVEYCDPPAGVVADRTDCDDGDGDAGSFSDDADCDGFSSAADCDDSDPAIHPGASETWYDGIDSNCDEASDYDADADGHDSVEYDGDDCNDEDDSIYTGAIDAWYDGIDSNCDDASDYDADADGHDHAEYGGDDCDDLDGDIHPGASDTWYDGVDSDCDDSSDYDMDVDGHDHEDYGGADCDDLDGDIHPGGSDTWYDGVDSDCDDASDYDMDADGHDHEDYGGDDCNDSDGDIHPGASETWYDGVDGNCDGASDYDSDSDGHLHPSYGGDDCDDAVGSTYPGASDTWYDGVDGNCDGANDYDADADGHNHSSHGGDDCDDACSTCYPGSTHSTESPDGRNQDCDSAVDELDGAATTKVCNAPGTSPWYRVDSEYGGLQRACRAFCGHDAFSISGCNTGGGCFGSMWSEYNFSTCTPSGGYTGCPNGGMDWSCPFSCICRDAYR